jgi:hypothetical protein
LFLRECYCDVDLQLIYAGSMPPWSCRCWSAVDRPVAAARSRPVERVVARLSDEGLIQL